MTIAPVPVPLADLAEVHRPMMEDLRAAFERVVSQSSFTLGAEVQAFEAELARYVHARHAVGVASGTAALQLALVAAGIGPGDEVILPPNTFFATVEAVLATGAQPVLADVDPGSALLDVDAAEAAVTRRTAAVVPVHLFGQPVDADRFRAFADRHQLFLLEDAAQAIGATWDGRPVGSTGDATAFSFYPGKNLGALGDGGAVTTSDPQLARRIRLLRSHGEEEKHVHEVVGLCERLDGLQAAFLLAKLRHFETLQLARDAAAARYATAFLGRPDVRLLDCDPRARHVHHLLVVRVPERDAVLRHLQEAGVGAAVHYPTPIHLQPATSTLGKRGQFPHAESLASSIISLPLWAGISDGQVDRVVDMLTGTLSSLRRD